MCKAALGVNTAKINYRRASDGIKNTANKLINRKFYTVFAQGVDFVDKFIEFTVECTQDKLIIPLDDSVNLEGTPLMHCSSVGASCVIDLYAVLRYEKDNAAKAAVVSMIISGGAIGGTLIMFDDKGCSVVRRFFGKSDSSIVRHYIKEHSNIKSTGDHDFAPHVPGPWHLPETNSGPALCLDSLKNIQI